MDDVLIMDHVMLWYLWTKEKTQHFWFEYIFFFRGKNHFLVCTFLTCTLCGFLLVQQGNNNKNTVEDYITINYQSSHIHIQMLHTISFIIIFSGEIIHYCYCFCYTCTRDHGVMISIFEKTFSVQTRIMFAESELDPIFHHHQ